MDDRRLLRLSRWTRPWMRHRTPVMHTLSRFVARLVCPKGTRRRIVVDYDGGQIVADTETAIGWSLLFRGCHEPEVARLIARLVPAGATCLDVGANIGAHALVMARAAGPDGRVIAFEPHPELCERLRENVALNAGARVEVVCAAVAERDGSAELHPFEPGAFHRGSSTLLAAPAVDERPRARAAATLRVPTLCGATIERRFDLSRCDFVKIDVEGYDGVVLESLAALVERTRPTIVFEHRGSTWAATGSSVADTLERLRGLGYALFAIRDGATRPLEGAPPDSCELLAVPAHAAVTLLTAIAAAVMSAGFVLPVG